MKSNDCERHWCQCSSTVNQHKKLFKQWKQWSNMSSVMLEKLKLEILLYSSEGVGGNPDGIQPWAVASLCMPSKSTILCMLPPPPQYLVQRRQPILMVVENCKFFRSQCLLFNLEMILTLDVKTCRNQVSVSIEPQDIF